MKFGFDLLWETYNGGLVRIHKLRRSQYARTIDAGIAVISGMEATDELSGSSNN